MNDAVNNDVRFLKKYRQKNLGTSLLKNPKNHWTKPVPGFYIPQPRCHWWNPGGFSPKGQDAVGFSLHLYLYQKKYEHQKNEDLEKMTPKNIKKWHLNSYHLWPKRFRVCKICHFHNTSPWVQALDHIHFMAPHRAITGHLQWGPESGADRCPTNHPTGWTILASSKVGQLNHLKGRKKEPSLVFGKKWLGSSDFSGYSKVCFSGENWDWKMSCLICFWLLLATTDQVGFSIWLDPCCLKHSAHNLPLLARISRTLHPGLKLISLSN